MLTATIVEENISNEEADEFKRTLRHVGELEWSCEPVELDYAPRLASQRQSRTQQFYRGQVPAKVAILMKKSQSVGSVPTEVMYSRREK